MSENTRRKTKKVSGGKEKNSKLSIEKFLDLSELEVQDDNHTTDNDTISITFKVTRGMRDRLEDRVNKEDMFLNRSELIRYLLQMYLEPNDRPRNRMLRL